MNEPLPFTPPRLFVLCEDYVFNHFDRYIPDLPTKVNQDIKERLWKYALREHLVDDQRLPYFLEAHNNKVNELDLCGCDRITDASITQHITKRYPNLQTINLSFCTSISSEGIRTLVQHCPTITSLNLSNTPLTDPALLHIASSLPNLKYLSLAGCLHITDTAFIKFLSKCADHLLHLDISHCKSLTSNSIKSLSSLSQLLHLDMSWCSDSISENSVQKGVRSCHKLQYLGVADSKISDSVIQKILSGSKIGSLDVSFCTGLFQSDKTVKYLNNVSRLIAAGCNITETTVNKILENLPELRELDVSHNDLLREQWLLNLINTPKLAPNLKVLNVNFCKGITAKVVQSLLQARYNLTVYSFCPM